MSNYRRKPVVFVSSTCYDLKQVRVDIKDFLEEDYGFEAMLSEFDSFPIDPCKGTFENCLSNVDQYADVFVLIVGTRYGYVTDKGKSITNLEYLHAKAKGIPIFVFVEKQIYNNISFWKKNKDGDFSDIVDSPRVFEFVSEIYEELYQWVYTFESVRDITMTLKNQFGLIFSDGLKYQKTVSKPKYSVLSSDISSEAIRAVIEQPYAWEYKFFAYVLKNELDKAQKRKWDLQYGIYEGTFSVKESTELLDEIACKFEEISNLVDNLNVIINNIFHDAIADNGVPSDLEMIVYASKRFVSTYEQLISWSLYFKSLKVEDEFRNLLLLLHELPKSVLNQMDKFVEEFYSEIKKLPDYDDGGQYNISLNCTLDISNTDEIMEEIERLTELYVGYKL